MASNDRFYQLSLGSRPAYWGDLGNRLQLSGFLLEGEKCHVVVATPSSSIRTHVDRVSETAALVGIVEPTVAEWCEIIREMDDPKSFEIDPTGGVKAIHRKMQRGAISGAVQQKIWARDQFKCVYCNRMMGDVQLSVDHFEPLEFGGADDQNNYLSACRRCNKKKGSMPAKQWCEENNLNYDEYASYLRSSKIPM